MLLYITLLQLRIVDENDKVVDVGEIGEVQAKNFLSMVEYRKDPEKTKQFFSEDGFGRTG